MIATSPTQPEQSQDETHELFLSYNSRDRAAVVRVRQLLHERSISTFFDRDQLRAGSRWVALLEGGVSSVRGVIVFIGPHGLGDWQEMEMQLALVRQINEKKVGHSFPVIPLILPGALPEKGIGFLELYTWVDLRKGLDDPAAIDELERAVRGSATSQFSEAPLGLCPYRALQAFRAQDEKFFFGREEFAEQLLLKTQQHNLIAVVGPSGSGKSSVVQAGLMPLLRRQRPPGPTWETVVFTPGTRPFHSLATTLVAIWGAEQSVTQRLREAEELSENLAGGKTRLENALSQAIAASEGADRLLVVVDQFEELFTLTEEKDRRPFVAALLSAASVAPITIALTLRADFYGQAIGLHRNLSDRMQQGVVNLGPMTRDELRRAIENPAHSVGLEFESGLVKNILDNIEDQPGNLPLLEFARKPEESKQAATEALDAARKIEDADVRSRELASVAEALAKVGKPEESRQAITEALDAARRIKYEDNRSQALVSVVEVLAKGRETADKARNAIKSAQQVAEQITNEGTKSAALANVATGLAKLHLYRQARELVDNNNTSAKDKLTAYTAILREYHLERHPDQAQLFAELPPKED